MMLSQWQIHRHQLGETNMNIFESIVSKIFHHDNASAASAPAAQAQAPTAAPKTAVNVDGLLEDLAAKNSQKLNWKTSIVDLLKLLNLDSSLEARKQLAQELQYSGDMNDSAQMNIWLSHEVMTKLAQNGGVVPADLKH